MSFDGHERTKDLGTLTADEQDARDRHDAADERLELRMRRMRLRRWLLSLRWPLAARRGAKK